MENSELVKMISQKTGQPEETVQKILEEYPNTLSVLLSKNKVVNTNFGSFVGIHYPESTMANPSTNIPLTIPERNDVEANLSKLTRLVKTSEGFFERSNDTYMKWVDYKNSVEVDRSKQ